MRDQAGSVRSAAPQVSLRTRVLAYRRSGLVIGVLGERRAETQRAPLFASARSAAPEAGRDDADARFGLARDHAGSPTTVRIDSNLNAITEKMLRRVKAHFLRSFAGLQGGRVCRRGDVRHDVRSRGPCAARAQLIGVQREVLPALSATWPGGRRPPWTACARSVAARPARRASDPERTCKFDGDGQTRV